MSATAAVTLLGGLGMFLLGIHHLTEGLKGLSGDSLRRTLQRLVRLSHALDHLTQLDGDLRCIPPAVTG